MLFFLIALTKSVFLTIDLGSESMRASMLERGAPVSIVLNREGRRFTPSVASILPTSPDAPLYFTDEEVSYYKRSVGDLSITQRYPLNSSRFLPLILGKNYSSKLISFLQRRNITMNFDSDEDNYIEIVQPPEFFASQLMSSAIEDCKRTKVNRSVDEITLIIPKFLTHHQRSAYVRSCKLATYTPHLVDTSTAVGMLFALERNQLFRMKPMYVCFIDIGASQMQVSIQEFRYTKDGSTITELGYAWTDKFGSYMIDVAIARVIKKEVIRQKPGVEFTEKDIQRMISYARKMKHELTLQPKVTMYLEDLVRGFDMEFTYSLDELKKLCSPLTKELNKTFFKAFHNAKFDEYEDIDRFELVGGGSRSPLFIDFITNIFQNKVTVLRSLNSEEASVIGGGYAIAASKGDYLSQEINFVGLDIYNISVSKGRFTTFKYSPNQTLPIGIKPFIRTVEIGQKGKHEIVEGRVRVHGCRKLTTSGIDKNKRTRIEKTLQAFEKIEKAQADKEKNLHEFDTFMIETRDKVSRDPIALSLSTQEERTKVLQAIADAQYTIQTSDEVSDEEIANMRAEIEKLAKPIIKRVADKTEAPRAIEKLQKLLDAINQAVNEDWPTMGLKPTKKNLKLLARTCSKTEKWLQSNQNQGATLDDILLKYEHLRKDFEFVKSNLKKARHHDEI